MSQLDERLRREGLKTHKERVEELNKYLSNLSEHHDMLRHPCLAVAVRGSKLTDRGDVQAENRTGVMRVLWAVYAAGCGLSFVAWTFLFWIHYDSVLGVRARISLPEDYANGVWDRGYIRPLRFES